ncbi:MAG: hypothetical protein QOK37_63 [Thermoanaerobaculia bacterium]|nr:hypothetical protein [Thermoanaerobaculia bacterium]
MTDRAVVFIDGNNWFHGLGKIGVEARARLCYKKISRKLLGPREWVATRYYIGQVDQQSNPGFYANQRSFLASLEAADVRISVHLGRIESRKSDDLAAKELRKYLGALTTKIDPKVFAELNEIAKKHCDATVYVEKAVDVSLAVDLVTMAARDQYDCAYILSADGDFTPAIAFVRSLGKKVFAASPLRGAQIAKAVNSFIPLGKAWFGDCYQ